MKNYIIKSAALCLLGVTALGVNAGNTWADRMVKKSSHSVVASQKAPLARFSSAFAAGKTVAKQAAQNPSLLADEKTVVLQETFSKFTAGSEEAPDMTNILNSEGIILQDYIETYGWAGISVYQAGGCAYLANDGESLLATPILDLSNDGGKFDVTVSFRTSSATTKFYVFWGDSSSMIGGRTATADTEWGTISFTAEGGVRQTMLQFYADADIYIDDIVIEQVEDEEVVEPFLGAPTAENISDIKDGSFTASWSVVQEATHYLLDVYHYENNERVFEFQDKKVEGNACEVTGLTDGVIYFYSVQAQNETLTSAESNEALVKVSSETVGTPVALPATEVSKAGFKANWKPAENAAFYSLTVYSYYTVPVKGSVIVENEDFSKVVGGTPTNPLYNALSQILDDYTKYPNWEGFTTVLSEGMIGLKNYYQALGQYAMLTTPIYGVASNNRGNVKIQLDAMSVDCSTDTDLGVCLVDAVTGEATEWQQVTVSSSTQTFSFTFPSSEYYYLAIAFADNRNTDEGQTGVVYVDNVRITQDLEKGDILWKMYASKSAYNEGLYIETPNLKSAETLSYDVVAITNCDSEESGYLYSDASEEIIVGESGAVEGVEADASKAYGVKGAIRVVAANAGTLEVYNLSGALVLSSELTVGESEVVLPAGLYVARVNGNVYKVAVK